MSRITIYEPHKTEVIKSCNIKSENTNLFAIHACDIIILFGTTCKRRTAHQLPQYHFTIFLHFAIKIKNKEQAYNFSESSKEPHANIPRAACGS